MQCLHCGAPAGVVDETNSVYDTNSLKARAHHDCINIAGNSWAIVAEPQAPQRTVTMYYHSSAGSYSTVREAHSSSRC